MEIRCLLSWSGWPDLNRRPLRPEAKLRRGLPAPQRAWPAADRPCMSADVHPWPWRLSLTSSLSRRMCADGCCPGTLGLRITRRIRAVHSCPDGHTCPARAASRSARVRGSPGTVGSKSVSTVGPRPPLRRLCFPAAPRQVGFRWGRTPGGCAAVDYVSAFRLRLPGNRSRVLLARLPDDRWPAQRRRARRCSTGGERPPRFR